MRKKDYYQILGVNRNASPDQIKKAYRKIALKYHPDKNPGDKRAEDTFKEASMAYRTLNEPAQRRVYDQSLGIDTQGQGSGGFKHADDGSSRFSDLFDGLFKTHPQPKRRTNAKQPAPSKGKRGSDIKTDLTVSFVEAIRGSEKTVRIQRTEVCGACDGTAVREGALRSTCPKCMGSGQVSEQSVLGSGWRHKTCNRCHGTGVFIQHPCRTCRGTGVIGKERSLLVKIPPGIENGKSLRLPGEGECGLRGGENGDLFVDITVEPHPVLQRDGYDLRCQIPIGFAKAALGGEIYVPTIASSAMLYIPRGTQCNQTFRLKGQGLKKSENECGDLLITVVIDVPQTLTRKQEKLLQEYAKWEEKLEPWHRERQLNNRYP